MKQLKVAGAGHVWIVTVDNCELVQWPCSAPCGVIDSQGEWAYRTEPRAVAS